MPRASGQFSLLPSLMKILVVEDERKTAAYLKRGLRENGFVVDVAENGEHDLYGARLCERDARIGVQCVAASRRRNVASFAVHNARAGSDSCDT